MSGVNYQQMHELRAIVHDHAAAPLANRFAAQAKYDKLLGDAVTEFDKNLDIISAKLNESVKPS